VGGTRCAYVHDVDVHVPEETLAAGGKVDGGAAAKCRIGRARMAT
jgi:hypothetical protein